MATFTLYISAGTMVQSEKAGMVELSDNAVISGAKREEDGGFTYSIGKNRYYTCSGVIEFEKEYSDSPVRHQDGLVWIG